MDKLKNIDFFDLSRCLMKEAIFDGVPFQKSGFPDLTGYQYITHIPEDCRVLPFEKRGRTRDPARTILAFFEPDPFLYRCLNRLDYVTDELRRYYAVFGFDLSPCVDFDKREQNMALLLNSLINCHFMSSGIWVVPTLRTGVFETVPNLRSYPTGICYAIGSLGCGQRYQAYSRMLMEAKILMTEPSELAIYGGADQKMREFLRGRQIPFVVFEDYHQMCMNRKAA